MVEPDFDIGEFVEGTEHACLAHRAKLDASG
jgi:hypothetical protein